MTTHLPEKHAGDEPFRLRVYGKAELACLYFPNASPETARRNLHRWTGTRKRIGGHASGHMHYLCNS